MWDEMPEDVRAELSDPRFISRKHYARATYALGCRGPLCQKAERDRGRVRNEERSVAKGNEYVPAMEFRVEDPPRIDEFIEWHIEDLAERRAAAKQAS